MAEDITLKDHIQERRIFLSRLFVASFVIAILLALLVARLFYLQIQQFDYYSSNSDNNRIYRQPVVPTRGLIYDRNGVLLATNRSSFNLTMIREHVDDLDASIELLRGLIDLTDDDIADFRARLRQRSVPFSSVPVSFNLTEDEMARIAVNQFRLKGFNVQAQLVRHYPHGEAMAHAVGYLSSITVEELRALENPANYSGTHQIGKMGVERFYESLLHGQVGYETVEKNARGQIMKVLDRTDPVPGQNIVLHLDSDLQRAAMEALGDYRGAVVALDVESGGVLAMVSKPSFDPNLFIGGISYADYARLNNRTETPLFNRALASYAPGSTVKPFIGLGSLEYGIRTREYEVHDPGYFRLPNDSHTYHDWTWGVNRSGHGSINLERAIYQSCNIYFYDLAVDMGIDRMHDFMARFGFGRNTSIDIPNADSGILPSSAWKREARGQPWYPGETLNSAIGQGYTSATPLQLATAALVLANKGKWKQPVMLKRIGLEGEDIHYESAYPDVELSDPRNWDFITDAMESVVHKATGGYRFTGSAYPYIAMQKKIGYRMAGKSGTAQVVGMGDGYYESQEQVPLQFRDHALFIAFAPADDPEIALAVFVEHGESGGRVAGPIARTILDAYLLNEDGGLKSDFLPVAQELSVAVNDGPLP